MVEKKVITLPGYKGGLGGRAWSPGLRVGPLLFLSGITPVDYESGKAVGRGEGSSTTPGEIDPPAQWRQVLGNIQKMMETAGGDMSDIVMANVFVTDMHFYYQYEWIRKEFFEEPYPVCTAVEVGSLVHPDWILEIEVIAYLGDGVAS